MRDSPRQPPYDSIYSHGFARAAAAVPSVGVGDVNANVAAILALANESDRRGAVVTVFPELCVTGYSNDDLFQQDALLDAAVTAIGEIVEHGWLVHLCLVAKGRL